MIATAAFETQQANRYLATLCRHFATRVPVVQKADEGQVAFPFGRCSLSACHTRLTLVAAASDRDQLDTVMDVVTRHLERFAFRENPALEWRIDPVAEPDASATF